MSRTSTLIRRLVARPVETAGDRSARPRDERPAAGTNGGPPGTSRWRIPAGWGVAAVILAGAVVNALSAAHDAERRGAAYDLGLPLFYELTSGIVIIALLPLVRHAVGLLTRPRPWWQLGLITAGTAVTFSGLHILGMVALRVAGAALAGGHYDFAWARDLPYEFRKDLLTLAAIGAGFWLLGRLRPPPVPVPVPAPDPEPAAEPPDILWLKDGATSIRVEPRAILTVTSAGNYVEFDLGDRRHLVRGTLTAEEARLIPFGIVRIHRTRLANLARVVQIEPNTSGDFTLQFDTGTTVTGSRRYREAVGSALGRA